MSESVGCGGVRNMNTVWVPRGVTSTPMFSSFSVSGGHTHTHTHTHPTLTAHFQFGARYPSKESPGNSTQIASFYQHELSWGLLRLSDTSCQGRSGSRGWFLYFSQAYIGHIMECELTLIKCISSWLWAENKGQNSLSSHPIEGT